MKISSIGNGLKRSTVADSHDERESPAGARALRAGGTEFWNLHPCGGDGPFARQLDIRHRVADPLILEILPPAILGKKLVLDLACGQGFDMTLAARSARFVVGADLALQGLKRAATAFSEHGVKNVMLVAADAEKLPFVGSFDLIYCIGGLNHVTDPERIADRIGSALKPGGTAIVMVYRRWTPLAMVVAFSRLLSHTVDRLTNEKHWMARRLERFYSRHPVPSHGTTLLELFGCPILRTYTKREMRAMFLKFSTLRFHSYRSGFDQVIRFLPGVCQSQTLSRCLTFLDRLTRNTCGFYLVLECQKPDLPVSDQ